MDQTHLKIAVIGAYESSHSFAKMPTCPTMNYNQMMMIYRTGIGTGAENSDGAKRCRWLAVKRI